MVEELKFITGNAEVIFIAVVILLVASFGLFKMIVEIRDFFNKNFNKKFQEVQKEESIDKTLTQNQAQAEKNKKYIDYLRQGLEQTDEDLQSMSMNVSSIKKTIKNHTEFMNDLDKQVELLSAGLVSILRNQIIEGCEKIQKENPKEITIQQFENLDGLFSAYEGLGGNHSVSVLRKWFNGLSVKVDNE